MRKKWEETEDSPAKYRDVKDSKTTGANSARNMRKGTASGAVEDLSPRTKDVPGAQTATHATDTPAQSFSLWVPITPVPKGRPRFWNGRAVTPAKTRKFESDVRAYVQSHYKGAPFSGPLHCTIAFYLERPKSVSAKKRPLPDVKPDLDNLWKATEDALNGVLWRDDSQIVSISGDKSYLAVGKPGFYIYIEQHGHN